MAAASAVDKNAYNYTHISFLHSSHSSSPEDPDESHKEELDKLTVEQSSISVTPRVLT